MFKLIGRGYRWYSKVMLWKVLLVGFGVLWLFATKYTSVSQRWDNGDDLSLLPETCFIAIENEPFFVPFYVLNGQQLKTIANDEKFIANSNGVQWTLYAYDG